LTEWWHAGSRVVFGNELHPTPTATLGLGLYTFGNVTVDAMPDCCRMRRSSATSSPAQSSPIRPRHGVRLV